MAPISNTPAKTYSGPGLKLNVSFYILRRNKDFACLMHFLESAWTGFAWKPQFTADEQWLQVDLHQVKKVKAIATQGLSDSDGTSSYCQSYTLRYSKSGAIWQEYKENDAIKVRKIDQQFVITKGDHCATVLSQIQHIWCAMFVCKQK